MGKICPHICKIAWIWHLKHVLLLYKTINWHAEVRRGNTLCCKRFFCLFHWDKVLLCSLSWPWNCSSSLQLLEYWYYRIRPAVTPSIFWWPVVSIKTVLKVLLRKCDSLKRWLFRTFSHYSFSHTILKRFIHRFIEA